MNFLLPFYSNIPDNEQDFYIGKFVHELESGNINAFLTRLQAFFADIPYELNDQTERHYQTVVKTPKYIYVFEFKLNGTAEQALQQIEDKGYLIPYQADEREVKKVGIEFSTDTRNVSRWLPEE